MEVQQRSGFAFSINLSLSASEKLLRFEGNWFALMGLWNCFLDLWFIDSSIWRTRSGYVALISALAAIRCWCSCTWIN